MADREADIIGGPRCVSLVPLALTISRGRQTSTSKSVRSGFSWSDRCEVHPPGSGAVWVMGCATLSDTLGGGQQVVVGKALFECSVDKHEVHPCTLHRRLRPFMPAHIRLRVPMWASREVRICAPIWAAAWPSPVLDGQRRRCLSFPQCSRLRGLGRLVEFFKRVIESCLSGGMGTADPTADGVCDYGCPVPTSIGRAYDGPLPAIPSEACHDRPHRGVDRGSVGGWGRPGSCG